MKEERDTLIIKFKSNNNIITNEVPSDIGIARFINIFYAAMVSNGWSDTVIVTAINQYVNEEDYPYDYSDVIFDENENNHFIHIIGKGSYSDVSVKVEYSEDSTALDIINILYGLLINLTYTRTTIIRAFKNFVEENEELILNGSIINNEDTECTDQVNLKEEDENTNRKPININKEIKDTFIKNIMSSIKNS